MNSKGTGSCGEPPGSKKELEILLEAASEEIRTPNERLEQYATPTPIAADLAWMHRGNRPRGPLLDLGCGTGRLLTAFAITLRPRFSVGVELDARLARACLESLRLSCTWADADVVVGDVRSPPLREGLGALVVMNPPFGTRMRGLDRAFFEAAFTLGSRILALHYDDPGVENYLSRLASRKGFRLLGRRRYSMALRPTLPHHRSRKRLVPVAVYVLARRGRPPAREADEVAG